MTFAILGIVGALLWGFASVCVEVKELRRTQQDLLNELRIYKGLECLEDKRTREHFTDRQLSVMDAQAAAVKSSICKKVF